MEQPEQRREDVVALGVDLIQESYLRFRLPDPGAERRILESIRRYGQITSAVVTKSEGASYEMIDGFKRLHACRSLGVPTLRGTVLDLGSRGRKAALMELNRKSTPLRPLEEALVVQSLYREETLTQVEIATLLGRHKSWVSRRIALVEALSEEVLEHLRLGLLCVTTGRYLSRLPRGNQAEALATALKYRLTSRESEQLISLLMTRPRWEQEAVLRFPEPILAARLPQAHQRQSRQKALCGLLGKLGQVARWIAAVEETLGIFSRASVSDEDLARVHSLVQQAQGGLERIVQAMEGRVF
jgi:ParB/RepB/Spo0J family partition protein